jgi:hypothetical protein
MSAIRRIEHDAAAAGYSWSAVISAIVKSTPFSMAVAGGDATATDAAGAPQSRKIPK